MEANYQLASKSCLVRKRKERPALVMTVRVETGMVTVIVDDNRHRLASSEELGPLGLKSSMPV